MCMNMPKKRHASCLSGFPNPLLRHFAEQPLVYFGHILEPLPHDVLEEELRVELLHLAAPITIGSHMQQLHSVTFSFHALHLQQCV